MALFRVAAALSLGMVVSAQAPPPPPNLPVGTKVGVRLPTFAEPGTQITCTAGFIRNAAGTLCVCTITATERCNCPPTMFRRTNVCACDATATVWRDNACACPPAMVMDGVVCKCNEPAVQAEDGTCSCPDTHILNGAGVCEAKPPPPTPAQVQAANVEEGDLTEEEAVAEEEEAPAEDETATLVGTIYRDRNGDRKPTPGEGIQGSTLSVLVDGEEIKTGETDENGAYSIPVRPGAVTIKINTIPGVRIPATVVTNRTFTLEDGTTGRFDFRIGVANPVTNAPVVTTTTTRAAATTSARAPTTAANTATTARPAASSTTTNAPTAVRPTTTTQAARTAGMIQGNVYQDDNKDNKAGGTEGLPEIEVILLDEKGEQVTTESTNFDGLFRFDNLKRGVYTVVVPRVPEGLNPSVDRDADADGKTTLNVNAPSVFQADFGYQRALQANRATVGGSVWEEKTVNGRRDFDEGIAQITVAVLEPSGRMVARTRTDREGLWSMHVLPGSYNIVLEGIQDFTILGNSANTKDNRVPVTLALGQPITNSTFMLQFNNPRNRGSITGAVWRDSNGNGFADEGEGQANATVIVQDQNGKERFRVLSGPNGEYGFTKLATGNHIVQAFAVVPGYTFEESELVKLAGQTATMMVELAMAQQVDDVDFKLVDVNECKNNPDTCPRGTSCINSIGSFRCGCQLGFVLQGNVCVARNAGAGGTMNGFIFNDKNGNGRFDAGEAAGGAMVFLANALTNQQVASTAAQPNGAWRIQSVPIGNYTITVQAPGSDLEPMVDPDSTPDSDPDAKLTVSMPIARTISDLNFGFVAVNRATPQSTTFDKSVSAPIERLTAALPGAISTVTGFVFRDVNNDAAVTPNEARLTRVPIRILSLDNREVGRTTSGVDGLFSFNVPPGRYVLQAAIPTNHVAHATTPGARIRVNAQPFMVSDHVDFPMVPRTATTAPTTA